MIHMKTIKSKRWYENQIVARKNFIKNLEYNWNPPYLPQQGATEFQMKQATEYMLENQGLRQQLKQAYNELNELIDEAFMYHNIRLTNFK